MHLDEISQLEALPNAMNCGSFDHVNTELRSPTYLGTFHRL